ncbi:MAG: PH domain-containing protein [Acidobacteria bacterium]|nr:PH domain-containing protein [Acidobacteriota bacterium]
MPSTAGFSASYDLTTKIVSAVVCVVPLGFALAAQSALVAAISVLLFLVAYGYSPRGYVVTGRSIHIKRLLTTAQLPLHSIRAVRAATADDLRGCFRLWGSGGFFGYYGLFWTTRLGKCTWYATARKRLVVVVTESKTALFSPDDVDGFLAVIRAEVPVPEPLVPAAPIKAPPSVGMWVGIGIGALALALAAAAMLYAPGAPRCTLTPDSLAIHDSFYPVTLRSDQVDVEHIGTVDVSGDSEWRATARTNGFANSHYRSGWFRVANGAKVRMYRGDATRLVLIPPKGGGAPVLLEAKDPEEFAARLRRTWSRP